MKVPQVLFICPTCHATHKVAVPRHGNVKPGDEIETENYHCPSCDAPFSGKVTVIPGLVDFPFDFYYNG